MADGNELLRGKLGIPSSSNPRLRALGVREEGEVSSGGEDESLLGGDLNLDPTKLSLMTNAEKSMKIGAIASSSHTNTNTNPNSNANPNTNPIPVPAHNPNLQRPMPQAIHSKSYNKRMPYKKLPNKRNLSWQKKRPLDDHNLVISFSDDESESDTAPANMQGQVPVPVRPQMPRSGPTGSMAINSNLGPNASAQRPNTKLQNNGTLDSSSVKVLETLRHEIAMRERSLKIQKVGPVEAVTDGRPAKRLKVEPPHSNGDKSSREDQLHSNQSLSRQNGDKNKGLIVSSKVNNNCQGDNGQLALSGVHRSVDVAMQPDTSVWLNLNAENNDSQGQLHLLLEQEDAQDRELEQAQEMRRRLEREERQALKAYRKAQRALFEANEKCNLLQKKRDLLSSRVNSLLENSSASNNTPWPLCWQDPRESHPADGTHLAMSRSRSDNREEGQLTDSTNTTKDQVEETALSDVDKRGSPSGNSSPQDYEALEASLRSELVARLRNKAPVNSTKSSEREMVDQPSIEIQENHPLSPNKTRVPPRGTTLITQPVPVKDFTESAGGKMVNQEKLPSGEPEENVSMSSVNASISLSERGNNFLLKDFAESAGEKIVNQENIPSSISPYAGGNDFLLKDFTVSSGEKMVNQEKLPSGEPQKNVPQSPMNALISLSEGGNNFLLKDFTETNGATMVDPEKLPSGEPQENIPSSPMNASMSGEPQKNVPQSPMNALISLSEGDNNFLLKDFTETDGAMMVDPEKLPSGEPQENIPSSPMNASTSLSEGGNHLPLKYFSEERVNEEKLPSGEPQENIALSPIDALISFSEEGNNLPLKDFTESAGEERVNEEKLPPGEPQENIALPPMDALISFSEEGNNLPLKDFTESAGEEMVNQEKLPSDEPQMNTPLSPMNASVSLSEEGNCLPLKDFTKSVGEKMANQEKLPSPKGSRKLLHSMNAAISLSAAGSNSLLKDFTESGGEKMSNQEKLPFLESEENIPLSPKGSHSVNASISLSAEGKYSLLKDVTDSSGEKLSNQEKLPSGEPPENVSLSPRKGSRDLPHSVNALISPSTSVSFSESNHTPLKIITRPAVNEPGENIIQTLSKTNVLPPSVVRNACVHMKQMVISISDEANNARYDGMDIIMKEPENAREDTSLWGPEVDAFWPFCIFELRGRCNDEECRWQHAKDYDWRNFKPPSSLTSPSGFYQHVLHVPTYRIGSYLIKDGPYLACSYWQRGFRASFSVPVPVQRLLPLDAPCLSLPEVPVAHHYNELSSFKLLLEEDLPEEEKCLELALNSSLGKKKVLSLLSRALERDPKSVLTWIVYLHVYYMKEKDLGEDDMFLHAVHNNKFSYDLWLIYINSRLKLEDQLSAFSNALSTMCQMGPTSDKEKKDQSSVVLDLYLHMVNIMCMSGRTEAAISRVFRFSSDGLLTAVRSSLVVPDKCIFWVSSIYLSIYGKLPEGILEQLELEKNLDFVINWPSINLRTDVEVTVLGLFKNAFIDIGLVETDQRYLKELHFLAVSHVKCAAAVQGLNGSTGLLVKYKEIYPNCVELALMLARLGESVYCVYNSNQVAVTEGFEAVVSDWPRQSLGFQCIWNQCVEYCLASKNFNLACDFLNRWFGENKLESFIESNDSIPQKEQLFGLLNLCLYQLMQNDLPAAHLAVDKALKLSDQEFYKHCLREHVTVHLLKESLVDQRDDISSRVALDLIEFYLKDTRTRSPRKVLSRKFYQDMKNIKARQVLDEWLGRVSDDYSSINSILEICYGESLIPEMSGIKELVNLAESVLQISPANYWFALAVCRFVVKNFGLESDDNGTMSVRFWAGSVMVNSIFQSVPVAPEPVWVEGAEVLVNLKLFEISKRFLEQAVSVYPFSCKLWQLYLSLSKRMNENGDSIVAAAKERGIELSA